MTDPNEFLDSDCDAALGFVESLGKACCIGAVAFALGAAVWALAAWMAV